MYINWRKKIYCFFIFLVFLSIFNITPLLSSGQGLKQTGQQEAIVRLVNGNYYRLRFTDSVDLAMLISNAKDKNRIDYIEPNYTFNISAFPNDPEFQKQQYLKKIQAVDAWSKEMLEKQMKNLVFKPVIAVIDTGVYLDHPDLKDNIWQNKKEIAGNGKDDDNNGYIDDKNGWDFVNETADPGPKFSLLYSDDAINHGTIVAGIAAAHGHNNEGIAGVSWDSQIMSLRALDSLGRGNVYNVSRAVAYARQNGANIINMSFVGLDYSQTLYDEIKAAYDAGIIIVAAAGNTDPSALAVNMDKSKNYPVCYSGLNGENLVIGVASVDSNDKKSVFSNYGADCVDISAPGENFFSTVTYNPRLYGYDKYYKGYWSGTSLSAPVVSGALALLKSLRPQLSSNEIKDILLNGTDNVELANSDYIGKLGTGRLNLYRVVDALLLYTPRENKPEPSEIKKSSYLVAGLGAGSTPQIKIYNLENNDLERGFYAYNINFKGIINVASGDVDGDGVDEIITGPGSGGGPHVRIFDKYGNVKGQFFAYNPSFRGGISIATGDINFDGVDEIITGAGPGGGPHVRVFNKQGNVLLEFFAFDSSFKNGVYVAAGDVNGDSLSEIIVSAGVGAKPEIKIFDQSGLIKGTFLAFNEGYKNGVYIAAGDVNGDNRDEIIATVTSNGLPSIKIFNQDGYLRYNFLADELSYNKGYFLFAKDIDADGINEIITGQGQGGKAEVKVFDRNGKLKKQMLVHNVSYRGGIRPAIIRY